MSGDDSIQSRQNNEFSALTAIFNEAVQDLRQKAAWNSWVPLDFKITVYPQRGESGLQEAFVFVDVHVVCTEKYPHEPPTLTFEKSKGLSNVQLSNLESELRQLAQKHAEMGQEMIYQLVQHVEEFLYANNKPATKSFYEEMILRRKEQELLQQQEKELQHEKERQLICNEIQKRKQYARHEKNSSDNSSDDLKTSRSSSNRKYTSMDEDSDYVCEHNFIKTIRFTNGASERIIHRGKCINHSHNKNCTVYNGMDTNTGQMFVISEWILPESSNLQKLAVSLEQEFNYLIKLKHQNLALYLSIKNEVVDANRVAIYLMREFVYGSNCNSLFITESIPAEIDRIKHIATGVLSALDFLHRNNVVHKDISESCVYIDKRGIIKVANYSLDKRVSDFTHQNHHCTYNKKTDIYKFGLFLLSILTGSSIRETEPVIPHTIPSDLYDFLSKCLAKVEKYRYTAGELLNHSFLRLSPERLSPRRNSEEARIRRDSSPEAPTHDYLAQNSAFGQSRVYNEFEVLDSVGKGAFGEVYKVKNKLDQRVYAIKRILLNPKEVTSYKRLFREVKYLSRLNHENVVRYYNSWIEKCTADDSISIVSSTPSVPDVIQQKTQELSCYADIEKFAPPPTSFKGTESDNELESSSDEDSESSDDEDSMSVVAAEDDASSSSIEFIHDDKSTETNSTTAKSKSEPQKAVSANPEAREFQLMYIQMEFCEKSTLRTAIDDGLHKDVDRMWRLFREIVEGLAHIHQQTLIHRDLKPVNIFLDSNDHVKIGDFGLATTYFLSKPNDQINSAKSYIENFEPSQETDEMLTGQIGTALYIAPEIASPKKVSYSTKVDIYSLGIILFEMSYKPLMTSMERIMILKQLRTKEISFPKDFLEGDNEKQIYLIRWLLNHDVEKRPSSLELLQSDYIPPPVLEERELRELVRTTLNNRQLKAYKYLIESCFQQAVTPAQDIMYNNSQIVPNFTRRIYNYARKCITKVFSLHGGQNVETPLLAPKNSCYGDMDTVVNLMTNCGNIVSLPYDLRAPFARYVAWNSITLLRRFSISRVYREKKVFNSQPRELIECAFDIVSPTPGNFLNDAEVIYILNEVMAKFPALKNKDFIIYLNHTLLLKAVLLHCGIRDNHNEICNILADSKGGKVTKLQIKSKLETLGLSDKTITTLDNILSEEGSIDEMTCMLQSITKKKNSEAAQWASEALKELKMISRNVEALGVKYPVVLSLRLVHNNILQYSGMTCHLACRQMRKKNKRGMEVLAAGGRYDSMINTYRTLMEKGPLKKGIRQSAVGISISLDKLVQTLQGENCQELDSLSAVDVGMCSLGSDSLIREKARILRELWANDIRCCVIDTTSLEEVDELCTDLNCPYTILIRDSEDRSVIVRSKERERFHEKKVSSFELVDYLQKVLRNNQESNSDAVNQSSNIVRSDSKISNTEKDCDSNCTISINFETTEKYSSNQKRRYENQIRLQLEMAMKKLQGEVKVIVVNLDSNVIRSIVGYLDYDSKELYEKSLDSIIERHPRHKKYLRDVCDDILEAKKKSSTLTVALYSITDNFYRLIL